MPNLCRWFKKVEDGIKRAVYEWIPPKDMNAQINHFRMRKEQELSGEKENLKNIKVADLCAAPGGKTFQLIDKKAKVTSF